MSHNIAAPPPGIYTPFPPFYHDEQSHSIDLTKLLRHVSRLAKAGITGLLINSPSVFPRHTAHAEGVSLIRSIRAHISGLGYGKFTIIASIPAANVRRALEEIDGVKGAGADYALVIPPVQGKGNRSFNGPAVMGFVYDVAQSSSLPILTSDISSSCVAGGIDTVQVGTSDAIIHSMPPMPRIVGWKSTRTCPSTNKLSHICGEVLSVPSTSSLNYISPALEAGALGVVVNLANLVPRLCVRLYKLYREGDLNGARILQRELSGVSEASGKAGDEGVRDLIAGHYGYGYGREKISVGEMRPHMSGDLDSSRHIGRLLEMEDKLHI